MTSISYFALGASDEPIFVDVGFCWNSPIRGVSKVEACFEAGAVDAKDIIAASSAALNAVMSVLWPDIFVDRKSDDKVNDAEVYILSKQVNLDRVLPCAQRSVVTLLIFIEVGRTFERSKLIVHDSTHEIDKFLQVEYDNVAWWQWFGYLQIGEQRKIA